MGTGTGGGSKEGGGGPPALADTCKRGVIEFGMSRRIKPKRKFNMCAFQ